MFFQFLSSQPSIRAVLSSTFCFVTNHLNMVSRVSWGLFASWTHCLFPSSLTVLYFKASCKKFMNANLGGCASKLQPTTCSTVALLFWWLESSWTTTIWLVGAFWAHLCPFFFILGAFVAFLDCPPALYLAHHVFRDYLLCHNFYLWKKRPWN